MPSQPACTIISCLEDFVHFMYKVFFCGKANLKNINQERSRKIPPCNHVFVIVLDSLGAAFKAAIKDAFFVVSVKQKREFCWRFSAFSSTLEEKGEMLLERPVFSFFSKLVMPLFYDKKFLRGRWFEESSLGWTWCWRNLWMQKVKGINRDIPFPVSFRNEVSSAENLIFDPDDMNDFNAFGCYFQNFAAKIVIGKGSYIAPNVGLVTANHVLTDLEQHQPGKDIVLGKNCWIGMNSTVLPGVVLGDHTVVGAGSVVTKSFPEGWQVIAGNPAKVIRKLEKPTEN